ncbi:MAG: tRNA (adenosine(37)-N6)-threonylcarbamoyltransferase complex dimerization subunit type 1 TsaB [Chloroflexi bacterium]|nr:tRNA (adenosine(37)-N6)-threonylcarbamoyltransferase complex dimerization subunit type 1 TsaB [Chloroflexota bacterium]
MILAIDTSTSISTIALFDVDVHAELTWIADQKHTTELLPEIGRLLQRCGLKADQLNGIVVALGPGSFNGLRVGLSTAKGLCLALRIPIVGVGTLEALAYQYALAKLPVRPITDAGRGELNTALYEMRDRTWVELEAPWIGGIDEIRRRISAPTLVCGDTRKEAVVHLCHELGGLITEPAAAGSLRRAGYLAELGGRKLRAGKTDDLASLQPIYLRKPAITGSTRTDALAVRHPVGG